VTDYVCGAVRQARNGVRVVLLYQFQESSCQGRCAFLHRTATDRQSVRRATKEDIYTCTRRHLRAAHTSRVTRSHPRSRLAHTVLLRRRALTAAPSPPHTPSLPRARPRRPRRARVVRGRHRECRGNGGRTTARLRRTCQIKSNNIFVRQSLVKITERYTESKCQSTQSN
jgi:hypothetical protein